MSESNEFVDQIEKLGAHDLTPSCDWECEPSCTEKVTVYVGWSMLCCPLHVEGFMCRRHHDDWIASLMERAPHPNMICQNCRRMHVGVSRFLDTMRLEWSRAL